MCSVLVTTCECLISPSLLNHSIPLMPYLALTYVVHLQFLHNVEGFVGTAMSEELASRLNS